MTKRVRAVAGLYGRLRLRINASKSAVARVWERKFLGFSSWVASGKKIRIRVADQALAEMRERVWRLTRRTRGRNTGPIVQDLRPHLPGWKAYFRLADTPRIFSDQDEWVRHRLRAIQLSGNEAGRPSA